MLSGSFQTGFTLRAWNEYIANGWTTTSVERLASMIAALPASETLFVWGDEAELYTLSGRLPTTRFLRGQRRGRTAIRDQTRDGCGLVRHVWSPLYLLRRHLKTGKSLYACAGRADHTTFLRIHPNRHLSSTAPNRQRATVKRSWVAPHPGRRRSRAGDH